MPANRGQNMAAGVRDIMGVEILKPGVFQSSSAGRVEITPADIEAIVATWKATRRDYPPRVQLGHDLRQRFAKALFGKDADGADGMPALGWVDALRVTGGRLLADFKDVPLSLIDFIKDGRYRARSSGLWRAVEIGGKEYEWFMDHVALLGDQAPAVPGLADMMLDRAGLNGGTPVMFSYDADAPMLASPGDGLDAEEATELDGIMSEFDALTDRWAALVYGQRGAPAARTLWAEFAAKLRAVAKANLTRGDTMPEDTTLPGATAPGAITFAGMTFETPEQLVGWLAGALGKGPTDYSAIAEAVAAAMGSTIAAPDADPNAPVAEGEAPMSAGTTPGSIDLSGQLTTLSARVEAETTARQAAEARVAGLEVRLAREAAERRVDGDITTRSLPVAIRPTLIDLALGGKDALYAAVLENARPVPTGEIGTSASPVDLSAIALSDADRTVARQLGISEADFAKARAAEKGLTLNG
ncbi:MAG: hypothetical protein IPK80_02960 [Nannocystis sp.]|nr:hypothetical protein [Nannocystis sp.]